MPMNEIISALSSGLSQAWDEARIFSDDPHIDIEPEYIVTVNVARSLSHAGAQKVRMEQNTKPLLFRLLTAVRKLDLSRQGKVDIFAEKHAPDGNLYVEVKRYVRGFSEIKKDLTRCAELINAGGTKHSHVGACVFFYRVDGTPIFPEMQNKMVKRYKDLDAKLLVFAQSQGIEINRTSINISKEGFENDNEAKMEDEDGIMACDHITPYLTEGVILLITKKP